MIFYNKRYTNVTLSIIHSKFKSLTIYTIKNYVVVKFRFKILSDKSSAMSSVVSDRAIHVFAAKQRKDFELKREKYMKSKLVSINFVLSPLQEVNYMCPLNSEGFPDR